MTATPFDSLGKRLENIRISAFPDLFFTGYDGGRPLVIAPRGASGRILRLSLAAQECFHLSGVKITRRDEGIPVECTPKSLRTSSSYSNNDALMKKRTLFNGPHKKYGFHTLREQNPWVEIDLGETVEVVSIVLANREDAFPERAWTLQVELDDGAGTRSLLYDHDARARQFADVVQSSGGLGAAERLPTDAAALFVDAYAALLRRDFSAARAMVDSAKHVSDAERQEIRRVLNATLLPALKRQWNRHGIRRTFRFWATSERRAYLRFTNQVITELRSISDGVCLGFGAVLGLVRDRGLIDHDDDLDVLVTFDRDSCPSIREGLRRVTEHLSARGYLVRGDHLLTHRQIYQQGKKSVDVFVGLREGNRVAWYPQQRGGLSIDDVFPPITATLVGVECPIPKNPFRYLESVYGKNWAVPKPSWGHNWDSKSYADIL